MAETTAGDILSPHTHQIRDLTQRLRKLVKQAVPRATDKVSPGWHGFGFHDPKAGYFCGVFPQMDSVKLGIEFGRLLPDPQGLLHGDGKQVRYVVLAGRRPATDRFDNRLDRGLTRDRYQKKLTLKSASGGDGE
ncbi:MAG: DUF1801 domain-containing protein [Chloroflexi bacterium]|nr:DUF1801 domain-containing protein [Chloroflexota bacterium]MCY3938118.1 DUF1801 domain-containing protein [Chloroflexota bacterium]